MEMEEIKQMKGGHESEASWQRRKKFLIVCQSKYPKERLNTLSYCYVNVLLYGCRYSEKLMDDLYERACDVANYPWDNPVNMSKWNDIFEEKEAENNLYLVISKTPGKNIRKVHKTSSKSLKTRSDVSKLDFKVSDDFQFSLDCSVSKEYIFPIVKMKKTTKVVSSTSEKKVSESRVNKLRKIVSSKPKAVILKPKCTIKHNGKIVPVGQSRNLDKVLVRTVEDSPDKETKHTSIDKETEYNKTVKAHGNKAKVLKKSVERSPDKEDVLRKSHGGKEPNWRISSPNEERNCFSGMTDAVTKIEANPEKILEEKVKSPEKHVKNIVVNRKLVCDTLLSILNQKPCKSQSETKLKKKYNLSTSDNAIDKDQKKSCITASLDVKWEDELQASVTAYDKKQSSKSNINPGHTNSSFGKNQTPTSADRCSRKEIWNPKPDSKRNIKPGKINSWPEKTDLKKTYPNSKKTLVMLEADEKQKHKDDETYSRKSLKIKECYGNTNEATVGQKKKLGSKDRDSHQKFDINNNPKLNGKVDATSPMVTKDVTACSNTDVNNNEELEPRTSKPNSKPMFVNREKYENMDRESQPRKTCKLSPGTPHSKFSPRTSDKTGQLSPSAPVLKDSYMCRSSNRSGHSSPLTPGPRDYYTNRSDHGIGRSRLRQPWNDWPYIDWINTGNWFGPGGYSFPFFDQYMQFNTGYESPYYESRYKFHGKQPQAKCTLKSGKTSPTNESSGSQNEKTTDNNINTQKLPQKRQHCPEDHSSILTSKLCKTSVVQNKHGGSEVSATNVKESCSKLEVVNKQMSARYSPGRTSVLTDKRKNLEESKEKKSMLQAVLDQISKT